MDPGEFVRDVAKFIIIIQCVLCTCFLCLSVNCIRVYFVAHACLDEMKNIVHVHVAI